MHKILELLNVPMLMEPARLRGFLEGYRLHRPVVLEAVKRNRKITLESETFEVKASADDGYPVTSGGLAVIQICGPMFKGYGGYGYADQSELCNTMMMAANDPAVSGIMMLIDTPGGSVAGTADLGDVVKATGAQKPVHAYVDDLCASAGMWVACSASHITAGRSAIVGSIGVITTLVDATKYYENAGIKIVNVTTGNKKDVGDPARPMQDDDVDYIDSLIQALYEHFVQAVSQGRGIRGDTVRKMEASLYVGQEAVDAKLVDEIGTFADAMKTLSKATKSNPKSRARAMADNANRLKLEEASM